MSLSPMGNQPNTCWDTPHYNLTWRTARGCVETVMTHRNLLILSCSAPFYNFARIFANVGGGGERGKRENMKLFVKWHPESMPLTDFPRFPQRALSEPLEADSPETFSFMKSSFLLSGSRILREGNHSWSWKCLLSSSCRCWKRQTKSARLF